MAHETRIIIINDKIVEIDNKIADLIKAINAAGLKTSFSCEGDAKHSAYITFDLIKNASFIYDVEKKTLTMHWWGHGISPMKSFILMPDRKMIAVDSIKGDKINE